MEEIKLSEASIRFINYLRDPNASLYYTLGIDDVLTFLIKEATALSDVIVTGDVTYHTMLDSTLPIIDAGHFYTENPVLDYLEELLTSQQIESIKLLASEHEIKNLTIL